MGKLHELLAVEETVNQAAQKLLAETAAKFGKHSEFFTGGVRTLERLGSTEEDRAIEQAARQEKTLPTTVPATLEYLFPYLDKALSVKLQKHCTNQVAQSDIEMDGRVVMQAVPVDFLLDLEKMIPKWRELYAAMPTLDPSREWVVETRGAWKTKEPIVTSQTEKTMYPVELAPATLQHPAQVKEASRDNTVGLFKQVIFSGAATSQQKADVMALCDKLLVAVKQARMRANSVEIEEPASSAQNITVLFASIFVARL